MGLPFCFGAHSRRVFRYWGWHSDRGHWAAMFCDGNMHSHGYRLTWLW